MIDAYEKGYRAGVQEAQDVERAYIERLKEAFCDAHCVWTNHHPDCDKAQQEPVAWVEVKDTYNGPYEFHGKELLPVGKHDLYTSPPAQRTWVGLTDEELYAIDGVEMKYDGTGDYYLEGEYEFARAVEAKLKEKNI